MSEMILGIDLGTTNSAVGVVDSGFPYGSPMRQAASAVSKKLHPCLTAPAVAMRFAAS